MTANPKPEPARTLNEQEIAELLDLDVPLRLATLDRDGYPRITPLWFLWTNGAFYMTSVSGARHLKDLERDRRGAICIDVEGGPDERGVRPNRQVKARGHVELFDDLDGQWTHRITLKYVSGEAGQQRADRRAAMQRVVMRFVPERLIAFGI